MLENGKQLCMSTYVRIERALSIYQLSFFLFRHFEACSQGGEIAKVEHFICANKNKLKEIWRHVLPIFSSESTCVASKFFA